MKIWIVEGTTGEYSDCQTWVVCAYADQTKAEDHARNAMLRAKEIERTKPDRYSEAIGTNYFDPDMKMDYTGTEYYTIETELRD